MKLMHRPCDEGTESKVEMCSCTTNDERTISFMKARNWAQIPKFPVAGRLANLQVESVYFFFLVSDIKENSLMQTL